MNFVFGESSGGFEFNAVKFDILIGLYSLCVKIPSYENW
jgi:hypothetical protein